MSGLPEARPIFGSQRPYINKSMYSACPAAGPKDPVKDLVREGIVFKQLLFSFRHSTLLKSPRRFRNRASLTWNLAPGASGMGPAHPAVRFAPEASSCWIPGGGPDRPSSGCSCCECSKRLLRHVLKKIMCYACPPRPRF